MIAELLDRLPFRRRVWLMFAEQQDRLDKLEIVNEALTKENEALRARDAVLSQYFSHITQELGGPKP